MAHDPHFLSWPILFLLSWNTLVLLCALTGATTEGLLGATGAATQPESARD
jgi:hypothetical protein